MGRVEFEQESRASAAGHQHDSGSVSPHIEGLGRRCPGLGGLGHTSVASTRREFLRVGGFGGVRGHSSEIVWLGYRGVRRSVWVVLARWKRGCLACPRSGRPLARGASSSQCGWTPSALDTCAGRKRLHVGALIGSGGLPTNKV